MGGTWNVYALAFSFAICGRAAGEGAAFQNQAFRDSAGIVIVETDGARARRVSEITVETHPALQIGNPDRKARDFFSDIAGVALLGTESVVILDDPSAQLLFYDLNGRLIQRRGSRDGVREFARPILVPTSARDSVLIFDRGPRRFAMYSISGRGFRIVSGNVGGGRVIGAAGNKVLVFTGDGPPPGLSYGPSVFNTHVRIADLARRTSDTVTLVPYYHVRTPLASVEGMTTQSTTVPFTYYPAAATYRSGFYLTTRREPAILQHSWTGQHQRIIRLRESLVEVTDSSFKEAVKPILDDLTSRTPASAAVITRAFALVTRPQFKPAFSALLVDEDGWLWAQNYEVGKESRTWLLFDPEGVGQGSVLMPAGFSVRSISRTHVAGIWRDDQGIQYVRLYRINGRR